MNETETTELPETKTASDSSAQPVETTASNLPQSEITASEPPQSSLDSFVPNPQDCLPTVTIAYDKKMITALTRSVLKKMVVVFGALGVFFTAIGILFCVMDDFSGGFVLGCGLFLLIFYPLLYALVPLLAKSSPTVKWKTVTTLVFGDRIYGSEQSSVSMARDVMYEWAILIKATEDKEYFFLFLTKQNAFTVRKSDLKNCNVEGFRALLRNKLGNRYKGK